MAALPLIDIAGLASPRAADRFRVAREMGAACREIGFFAVTGHGMPQAVIDRLFAASRRFFAQPSERKSALAIERLKNNRGYVGLGVEGLDDTRPGDLKEAFNLFAADPARPGDAPPGEETIWPELPDWRDAVAAYADACFALGRTVHGALARDLGLPETFFDDKLRRRQTLRLLHYPPLPGDPAAGQIGAGAHTDYGTLTILATDGVPGLQVRRRDGVWLDVPALDHAFICNIGDCLMRWSNDVYVSTPHRVIMPAAGARDRYSAAFFQDVAPEVMVSALPGCVAPGERAKYPPILAGEYLNQRLDATYAHRRKAG